MQISALVTTLAIAILGGLLSGFIASRFGKLEHFFDDTQHFHECEPDGKETEKKELTGRAQETEMEKFSSNQPVAME